MLLVWASLTWITLPKAVRTTPALARMPVVMLTGATMAVDEGHRAALRPQAYFVKPVLLSEYQQLVEKLE
jgi:CheY-like chemotaxis protein